MKNRKWTAWLLVLALLNGGLVSCKSSDPETTETLPQTESETETEETLYDPNLSLPTGMDCKGLTINMLTRGHDRFRDEMTVEEATGDVVNDAVYQRESIVEETLNIVLDIQLSDPYYTHGSPEIATQLVTAGDTSYDILSCSLCAGTNHIFRNTWYNLLEIDTIDITKDHWMQEYLDNAIIGDGLYMITGDISYAPLRLAFVNFFNKDLVEAYALEDPYELVREGKWTLEKQREMLGEIYVDTDGNGLREPGDEFGLGTANVVTVDAYTSSFDLHMIEYDDNRTPYLAVDQERFVDAIEGIYSLLYETEGVYTYDEIFKEPGNYEHYELANQFSKNKFVFMTNWLYAAEQDWLRNMEAEYGVIPYPKFREDQNDYYTFIHDQISGVAILSNCKNPEIAGAVLESMAYLGKKLVIPAYYDIALKGKYSRDEETREMLDLIRTSLKLDGGWIYMDKVGDLAQQTRNIIRARENNFVSAYMSKKQTYELNIEAFIAQYQELQAAE